MPVHVFKSVIGHDFIPVSGLVTINRNLHAIDDSIHDLELVLELLEIDLVDLLVPVVRIAYVLLDGSRHSFVILRSNLVLIAFRAETVHFIHVQFIAR